MTKPSNQKRGTSNRTSSRTEATPAPRSWAKQVGISLGLVAAAILAVVAVAAFNGDDDPEAVAPVSATDERLVRPNSQRVTDPPDSQATFVEFLDPECEACRATFPAIEQLIDTYGDRITFVARYMPLHANSVEAAQALEAAADQGQFHEMLTRLFETQPEWGEKQSSQRATFFALARELGLDMARFTEVYDDPATAALVERDETDGRALGVTGTPTFFLDGQKIQPSSLDDLAQMVDDALATP